MSAPSGTQADMYAKYYPGEPWTIIFEPTAEQRVAVTRHAQGHARDGGELKTFMMALGLMAYDAASPAKRDAPKHRERDERRKRFCPQGHPRATHSVADSAGRLYCRTCKQADGVRRRDKARARKAAA